MKKHNWKRVIKMNRSHWDDGSVLAITGTAKGNRKIVISRNLFSEKKNEFEYARLHYSEGYLGIEFLNKGYPEDCYKLKVQSVERKTFYANILKKFCVLKYFPKDVQYDKERNLYVIKVEFERDETLEDVELIEDIKGD